MAGEKELENLEAASVVGDEINEQQEEKLDALPEKAVKDSTQQSQESETEKQIRGLLNDLKRERERRSSTEEKFRELEERLINAESLVKELSAAKTDIQLTPEEEEEILSVKKARKLFENILSSREAEYEKRIVQLEMGILSDRLKTSEDVIKEKYSPAKVGEAFSYNKVIEEGFAELVKENPAYKGVVLSSANPAEEAYRIGLTHPKFQELLRAKTAEGVVEGLTKPKPKTGIGSSQGATGFDASKASVEDLLKLSDEELDKLAKQT